VVRRRVLGRELRRLRERAGSSLETAAPRLEWSVSKKEREVERAKLSFERLRSDALSPELSLALIRRTADQI